MRTSSSSLVRSALVSMAMGLCAFGAVSVQAETVALTAKLTAASEVPPNDSAGTGMADVVYDKSSGMLSWTVHYSGMTGPVKAGHFHGPAEAGKNAGVVQPFSGALESPIKGSATLSAAQAEDLLAGKWYVNLHTAAHGGGEVRGQVMLAK